MRVIFTPDGGFGETGGFIELKDGAKITGKEEVYQRQAFLRLSLICRDVGISRGISVIDERVLPDEAERKRSSSRRIVGLGVIQDARWQRHGLSFLGQKEVHHQLEISIRENPSIETAYVAGNLFGSDLDFDHDDSFFADIMVSPERMDMLMQEIQQLNAELHVSIHLSAFRHFYSTWSPAVDEGRVIKFLNSDRDIENLTDVPAAFWGEDLHRELVTDRNSPPVTVEVVRRFPSTLTAQDIKAEASAPGKKRRKRSTILSRSEAITAASKRISRRISILCVVLLVAAVIVAG